MLKNAITTCLLVFVLVAPSSASNGTADHLKSFDVVWRTVNETYFDPTFGGIDWKAMGDLYRPQVAQSECIEDFIKFTNQMLFELSKSHFLVATEKMLKAYMPTLFSEGTTGMDIRWIGNKAVITKIKPGVPANAAGLKAGYVITQIDGQTVHDIVARAEVLPPYNERNFRGGISNYLLGHINGPPNTTVSISYLDEHSNLNEATLVRQSRGTGKIISDALPPMFVEFGAKRLAGDVGYIRFNHFADPVDKAFITALETMRDTRGLIFDLRGNPGGYFRVLDDIIEQLITVATPAYRFRFRDKSVDRTLSPSEHPYTKPVVILVDVTSTSSSELFAACLQAVGRAAIIGERTPGYLLGAKWMKLPNGCSFMYSFVQPIPSNGRIVEGNGVSPDIDVGLHPDALLRGKDLQLDAAISYILNQSAQ